MADGKRGRPKLSPEQKLRRQLERQAGRGQAVQFTTIMKIPGLAEDENPFEGLFYIADAIREQTKSVDRLTESVNKLLEAVKNEAVK